MSIRNPRTLTEWEEEVAALEVSIKELNEHIRCYHEEEKSEESDKDFVETLQRHSRQEKNLRWAKAHVEQLKNKKKK